MKTELPANNQSKEQQQFVESNLNNSEDLAKLEKMNSKYFQNILNLTVMWTAASFSNYLLNFLNKYLEGSIY